MNSVTRRDLAELLSNVLGVSPEGLPDDASSEDVDQWDSLKHIEFVLTLEQEFEARFTPHEIASMDRLSKVEEVLRGKGLS